MPEAPTPMLARMAVAEERIDSLSGFRKELRAGIMAIVLSLFAAGMAWGMTQATIEQLRSDVTALREEVSAIAHHATARASRASD